MINYFVSYSFTDGSDNGFGSSQMELDIPISNMLQVRDLEEQIEGSNGFDSVVILNYKRFEEDERIIIQDCVSSLLEKLPLGPQYKSVQFEAACSGMKYSNPGACGEVAAVWVNGERFGKSNDSTVSDEAMHHLYRLYYMAFTEGYNDPTTRETKELAKKMYPHLEALNKEIGFKR